MCLKQKHLFPFPHGNVAQEACIVARSHCKNGYNRKDRLLAKAMCRFNVQADERNASFLLMMLMSAKLATMIIIA